MMEPTAPATVTSSKNSPPPSGGGGGEGVNDIARTVQISTKEGAARIVVDGNELSDVISYELMENCEGARLKLEILIMDSVEAQIQ